MGKPIVELIGSAGSAFMIIGKAKKAIQDYYNKKGDNKKGKEIAEEYFAEATSGDYDHLLQTTMKYCEVI